MKRIIKLALIFLLLTTSFLQAQQIGPARGGGGAPTGSAGGDLGGTYPNPTVLSVGDVTTGILSNANGGYSAPLAYVVTEYGAKCDGTTNDSVAVAAAETAAQAKGGGEIVFPAGTCIFTNQVINTNDWFVGQGTNTILKNVASATTPNFITLNFASLKGSTSSSGPANFGFQNLVIDGNYAGSAAADGIDIYGRGYIMDNVIIQNTNGECMYTEWSGASNLNPEARVKNLYCKGYYTSSTAIDFRGPTDSIFSNVIVSDDNGSGVALSTGDGFTQTFGALHVIHGHAWSIGGYAWRFRGGSVFATDVVGDGGTNGDMYIDGSNGSAPSNFTIIGGADIACTSNKGLIVGTSGYPGPTNVVVEGRQGCNINVARDPNGGGNRYEYFGNSSSPLLSGTLNALSQSNIVNIGTGGGNSYQAGNNGLSVCHAKYSFATDGGAVSTITPAVNCTLPAHAVIVSETINSTTALTSSGAATVAIGTAATGGSTSSFLASTAYTLLSANALFNGAVTYATPLKVTAAGAITFTVGTSALTAGVIEVWVQYYGAAS